MTRSVLLVAAALASGALLSAQAPKPPAARPPAPAAKPAAAAPAAKTPVFHIETAKGMIVVETFPADAPKSFEHILALVKKNFYRNQAVHRVVSGQAVQFGDPQSRNMQLKEWWGRGVNSGSGQMIGISEVSKTRKHRRGTLSIANSGSPALGDSQMFIALRAVPAWDGKYTILGQVTSGMAVADQLKVGDKIKNITASGAP